MDRKHRILLFTSIFIIAVAVLIVIFARNIFHATTQPITYYVATNGKDTNTGTIDSPFATVTKARDTIRATAQTNVIVYIRGGEYNLTAPVTFTSSDSGTSAAPNVYTNYPGETPIFKASKAVPTTVGDSGIKNYTLSTTSFPNIGTTGVPEIFYDGIREDIARSPNVVTPNFSTTDPFSGYFLQATSAQPDCTNSTVAVGNIIYFDNSKLDTTGWDLTNYQVSVKVWTGAPTGAYTSITRPVASIDQTSGKIMIGTINSTGTYVPQYTNHNICAGDNFYIQGEPNMIDKAGEYVYNKTTKTLSVNLPSTLTNTDKITVPYFLGPAFSVTGASNLQFRGLTINEVYGDGLFISGSTNIIADTLNVSGISGNSRDNSQGSPTPSGAEGNGVGIYISSNVTVQNSVIHDTQMNASIALLSDVYTSTGSAELKNLTQSNDQILNNELYDADYRGGVYVSEYGNAIKNNYIHDMPGSGIRGNLTLEEIAYNRIENTSNNVCDTGAIYTHGGGGFIQARSNKVHDNFIANTGGYCHAAGSAVWGYQSTSWGVYYDDVSSYNQTYNNIVVDAVSCFEQNFGWGNSWKNNICIPNKGTSGDAFTLNGDMSSFYAAAYTAVQNMATNGYNTTAYNTAFPDLTTMPATWDSSLYQRNLDIENNVVVGPLNTGTSWYGLNHGAYYFRGINNGTGGAKINNNIYYDPSTAGAHFNGGGIYPFSPVGCVLPYGTPPTNCQYDYQIWSLSGWQSHTFDTNGGKSANTDPLFTQASILSNASHSFTDNYSLQSASPAIAMGFVNINQSKIGQQPLTSSTTPVVSVSITSPTSGTTVSNTVTVGSSAATTSGTITQITISLDSSVIGSGTASPYSASFNSTSYPNGSHTLKATAVDSNGVSTTTSETVNISNTVAAPTSTTIHLDTINGSSKLAGSTWTAKVVMTAKDNLGNNIPGAVITGTWSGGVTGTASCAISSTTNSCSVTTNKLALGGSVTFTATSITATGLTYNAAGNLNGSSVTIQSPAPRK